MQSFDYPLVMEPIYVPRPWGGRRLQELYRRDLPEGKIGEAWELSDWPMEGDLVTCTKIANGPLAGETLDAVFDPFPVVVKLLDAHETLSVQAHPVPMDNHVESKNEMWYVFHADPGACLYLGLKEGVSAKEFCETLRSKPPEEKITGMMQSVPVSAGMHLNVPSGTIHSVGAGIVTFEVSQRTQVTYRLYDWNRKPERQLHLDEGCKAIIARERWDPGPGMEPQVQVEGSPVETITRFPTFAVSVAKSSSGKLTVTKAGRPHILTPVDGDLRFTTGNELWQEIRVAKVSSVLVPSTAGGYEAAVDGSVLITTV